LGVVGQLRAKASLIPRKEDCGEVVNRLEEDGNEEQQSLRKLILRLFATTNFSVANSVLHE
jgi:hypothetical protein